MLRNRCHKVVLQSLKLSSYIGGRFNTFTVFHHEFYLLISIEVIDLIMFFCFFKIFFAGFAPEQSISKVRPSSSTLYAAVCPLSELILQVICAFNKLDDLIEHILISFHIEPNIFQLLLYTYYMMNVRQLQLQSIIKNLQSKILTLRQQQKIINERYEGRVKEIRDQNARILAEKDKAIQYLRTEMDKDRELILYEQKTFDSCRNKERLQLITQLEKYRAKCAELEKRIQSSTEKYSLKNKDLEEENSRLREVVNELSNTSQMSLQTEIDKLNKFYHTSRVQQSRRQTTLDWIDKLANFIDRFNSENDKVTRQALSFLQLGLQNLKQQVINPLKAMTEQEQFLVKQRKSILSKIREIVQEQNKITQESSEENERIWEMMKKERNNQQTEKIVVLEKELANATQKYQEETNILVAKIKQLQNQRKTLLLGFTELKSLNQSREKTYRDEIAGLKQSVEELLAGIEQRQTQFESQVQTLYAQLSNLNQRYYENIEVPLHGLSGRIEVQLKAARQQIQKLTDNKGFNKLIQNLQTTLQRYVQEQAVSTKLSYELAQYSRKVEALVIIGKQILQIDTEHKMFFPDSPDRRAESQEKALMIQQKMKDVQYKQNQNKLRYQILTLKKHNKKLKDDLQSQLNQRQSSAIKGRQTQNRVEPIKDTTARVTELELEVENLTRLNQSYQEEFMYQLNSLKDSMKKIIGNEVKDNSDRYRFKDGINQVKECNQKILEFLDRENHHIKAVRQTLASLDRIMVKPVQVFDDFIAMISKCYAPFQFQPTRTKNENNISFAPFQKLKAVYNQVIPKRQDNAVSTNRLTAELIRTLRESLPASTQKSKMNQENQQEKLQKSRVIRQNPLERKIKDLQSQKIKNREEVLRKIEKVEECLRAMDQKIGKRPIANVQRIEEIFERKLLELSERYMAKTLDSSSQLSQITTSALKELKLKLRNCMVQNQGLVKELQYLQILKKQSQ